MSRFVHLNLHTEYSMVDSVIRIPELMAQVRQQGMAAVAMTDFNNMFALVKFYRAALTAGVKPIIGVDLVIREPGGDSRLLLLCQNRQGYLNLSGLMSRAYLEGQQQGVPAIEKAWLTGQTEGLIALSGGRRGDVGRALLNGDTELAGKLLAQWKQLFAQNYYLELQRTGRDGDGLVLDGCLQLAGDTQTPVVATNEVRFLAQEQFEDHEARVCINQGRVLHDSRRPREYSEQQYLRSPEEMEELFSDLPEALENSVEIARRCSLPITLGEDFLPVYPLAEGETEAGHLTNLSRQLLEDYLVSPQLPDIPATEYRERLQLELDVIIGMGFPGYFLIVADFIQWARDNQVPVGPGRGSGAGSLVAFVLGITRLDPLQYELLFERFLNPERVSLPDFDIDFCMEGRDRVIDYVAERYGRDRVSQIITYGTMAAKAVVRDAGRVLGHPYGFVDTLAKLVPMDLGITLDGALEQERQLSERYEKEEEVRRLFDLARSLEGLVRNAGKHAGGVVIAPSPLTDFTPLFSEPGGGSQVTQLDKDDVEAIGLVKFDFLGLRTLTIIEHAVSTIRDSVADQAGLDIEKIPLDDPQVFKMLQTGETTGVFQLESRGMQDLIRRLKPDTFDDIIALVALFRPGPLQSGMVDDFINRKHGLAAVDYLEPRLEPVLKATYGVILYQEQVMQIAQILSGFTLGGADLLRRAMGKKKAEEMAKQRTEFVSGALANGISEARAATIFDLIEKFAGYGFNKSHSAAYALVSYQTAWLKHHFPAAFMAAVLSADMDNTDKIVTLVEDCRRMELEVLPPDVNSSLHKFTVADDRSIRYGLGAIKGVGQGAVEEIIRARSGAGEYGDLFEFCRRVDSRKLNRRTLEALIRAGAMTSLSENRASLLASLTQAVDSAEQGARNQESGQSDLFGDIVSDQLPGTMVEVKPWSKREQLHAERESLGIYLTGHPIDTYENELQQFVQRRLGEIGRSAGKNVRVAGLVTNVRTLSRGRRTTFVTLDDRTARLDVTVYERLLDKCRDLLVKDAVVIIEGSVEEDDYTGGYKIIAEDALDINHAREHYATDLCVHLVNRSGQPLPVAELAAVVKPFKGGRCRLGFTYQSPAGRARISPSGDEWRVHPTEELLSRLKACNGVKSCDIQYR
ncbi:MAG: DNA polymerase III subunit alpha [Gammaproteobacteria bacterium]